MASVSASGKKPFNIKVIIEHSWRTIYSPTFMLNPKKKKGLWLYKAPAPPVDC